MRGRKQGGCFLGARAAVRILAVTKRRRRRRKSAESPGGNGGIYFERAPAALSGLGGNVGGRREWWLGRPRGGSLNSSCKERQSVGGTRAA